MRELSYFAIQSNSIPTTVQKVKKFKIQVQIKSKKLKNTPFNINNLHSGSHPNSTKFVIVRIQNNPSPDQYSGSASKWMSTCISGWGNYLCHFKLDARNIKIKAHFYLDVRNTKTFYKFRATNFSSPSTATNEVRQGEILRPHTYLLFTLMNSQQR